MVTNKLNLHNVKVVRYLLKKYDTLLKIAGTRVQYKKTFDLKEFQDMNLYPVTAGTNFKEENSWPISTK